MAMLGGILNLNLAILFFKMPVFILNLLMTCFSHSRKKCVCSTAASKNIYIYLLLTHEILLRFFILPEDSQDINSSINMEEELTVGIGTGNKNLMQYYSDLP